MSTHSLRDLRADLGNVVRSVAAGNGEAIITDNRTEIAVIISMVDYERLHEHADVADALHLRDQRRNAYSAMTMGEMLSELGVGTEEVEPSSSKRTKAKKVAKSKTAAA